MLLPVDLHEDFVDVKGIAIDSLLPFQSAGINGSEIYTPEANRFAADDNAVFGEQIFYIAVAQVEAIVEPDGIGKDRVGVGVVCKYSWADLSNFGPLSWQYRFARLRHEMKGANAPESHQVLVITFDLFS